MMIKVYFHTALFHTKFTPFDVPYRSIDVGVGLRSQDKIVQMRKALRSTDTAALLLTALDEVACK